MSKPYLSALGKDIVLKWIRVHGAERVAMQLYEEGFGMANGEWSATEDEWIEGIESKLTDD